jgi:FkbM family methyltransferase
MSDKTTHPPRWIRFAPKPGRTTASIWRRLPEELGALLYACDVDDPRSRAGWPLEDDRSDLRLVHRALWPGATFVAVGGDCGLFPLAGAHLSGPMGRVVVLQASARAHAWLQQNIARNQLAHVTAVAADVAGATSVVAARTPGGPAAVPALDITVTVRATPLDDLLDAAQVDIVSLLKIDVEGAEEPVFAGLDRRLGDGRIDRILLHLQPERWRETGRPSTDLFELFRRHGYAVWSVVQRPRALSGGRIDALRPFERADLGFASRAWVVREGIPAFGPVHRDGPHR